MSVRFLISVNDVIIAPKIRNCLILGYYASAQNILPRKVFRKKQILLINEVLAFQKHQKLKYEVFNYNQCRHFGIEILPK